jgi:hypothetical protein
VYVLKRPGVDEFLRRMGELYEIVVFTASVAKVNILSAMVADFTQSRILTPFFPQVRRSGSGHFGYT